jgi:hypothetical protein
MFFGGLINRTLVNAKMLSLGALCPTLTAENLLSGSELVAALLTKIR